MNPFGSDYEYGFDDENDAYRDAIEDRREREEGRRTTLYDQSNEKLRQSQVEYALGREAFLRWEHELSQPDYASYYLEDAIHQGRKGRTS